jgi:hypothetical protein
MKDKLLELQARRRNKMKIYNDTASNSWKKQLYRLELALIDNKIKLEQLKRQYR